MQNLFNLVNRSIVNRNTLAAFLNVILTSCIDRWRFKTSRSFVWRHNAYRRS